MPIRVGVNGVGRIGSLVLRHGLRNPALTFVAVNDLTDAETLAELLRFDSVHGPFEGTVSAVADALIINGRRITVFSQRDPGQIPWKSVGVDLVIEATGRFENYRDASRHLDAGARQVIITAPAEGVEKTLVIGINEDTYDPQRDRVVAMGSCTTYALAPLVKVLNDAFGIRWGLMNTVHAYTNTQALLDRPIGKGRRNRAAAINIVPTSTGAARAIHQVVPPVQGKMDGLALRVPVPCGSIIDLTCVVGREVTVEEVNDALRRATQDERLGRILTVSEEELVSTAILNTTHSSIVDARSTMVKGNLVKVLSWYDNEWSFALRVVELAAYIGQRLLATAPA